MPSTVGAGGSRDQIIRCSGWRPPAVVGSQPLLPCRLNEGGGGLTAAAELRGRGEAARVSDVDLEMGGRDVKSTCAHIRPVGETRNLLLGCCLAKTRFVERFSGFGGCSWKRGSTARSWIAALSISFLIFMGLLLFTPRA